MSAMLMTHRVHGIAFHRIGECNRCVGRESCCPRDCPHLEYREGGDWCAIHDRQNEPCWCGESHQVCAEFPDHPWLAVIKNDQCAYSFIRLDELGNPSSEPLPFMELSNGNSS